MLNIIRNNNPYTVIILFIFTLVIKLQALSHAIAPVVPPGHIFYGWIVGFFSAVLGKSAFGFTMLAIVMLFAQALFLNAIIIRYRLFSKPTYIIAYLYIVLTSLHPAFSSFSEILIQNWFFLGALNVLLAVHQTPQPRKDVYNAGFWLSMCAIIHFPAISYIILLFAAMILLRSFNPGEWIVAIMGYLTPVYFFACILFLFDKFPELAHWPRIGLAIPGKINAMFYTVSLLAGLTILFGCGAFVLRAQVLRSGVFVRRSWVMILITLVLSIAAAIATDIKEQSGWLIIMPALTLIIAQPLYLEKNKRFSNFAFYFSLAFVIVCQLAFK